MVKFLRRLANRLSSPPNQETERRPMISGVVNDVGQRMFVMNDRGEVVRELFPGNLLDFPLPPGHYLCGEDRFGQ